MDELLPRFERSTGHPVSVTYEPGKIMMRRIAEGETGDLALLGGTAVEDLTKQGKIVAGSRTIGSCGVGMAVLAGARKPDIGSVDAFKRALLDAKSIAFTQEGASGIHFSGLIEKLGIAKEVHAKAVRQPGGLVGELVAAGKAEVAIQQIPELMAVPGIDMVGPLPRELQATTVSRAGVFSDSKQQEAARKLLEFLASAEAARVFRDKGHDPHNQ
jgi:molybdate transport system substrate-binding protein